MSIVHPGTIISMWGQTHLKHVLGTNHPRFSVVLLVVCTRSVISGDDELSLGGRSSRWTPPLGAAVSGRQCLAALWSIVVVITAEYIL